jgi:hypothetical protein
MGIDGRRRLTAVWVELEGTRDGRPEGAASGAAGVRRWRNRTAGSGTAVGADRGTRSSSVPRDRSPAERDAAEDVRRDGSASGDPARPVTPASTLRAARGAPAPGDADWEVHT